MTSEGISSDTAVRSEEHFQYLWKDSLQKPSTAKLRRVSSWGVSRTKQVAQPLSAEDVKTKRSTHVESTKKIFNHVHKCKRENIPTASSPGRTTSRTTWDKRSVENFNNIVATTVLETTRTRAADMSVYRVSLKMKRKEHVAACDFVDMSTTGPLDAMSEQMFRTQTPSRSHVSWQP